jgi:hypothetical protein
MLALDDPRWASLTHAYRSAADTPGLLAQLRTQLAAGKVSAEVTEKLFSSLLHQGDVYPATVFAVPHVIAAATEARAEDRRLALSFAASAARGFDGCNRADYADANAWSEFDAAVTAARPLAIATARSARAPGSSEHRAASLHPDADVLSDLVVIADLHGWHLIAKMIEGVLDGVTDMECASCGEYLEVDLADLEAADDNQPSPELDLLAKLASDAHAEEGAQAVLALRGSMPCPECGEPLRPAQG